MSARTPLPFEKEFDMKDKDIVIGMLIVVTLIAWLMILLS